MPNVPDPDEVETLSSDESTFQRDEDGSLLPYWKVIEVGTDYRKIRLEPTPIGEFERLENRFEGREDLDIDEITDLIEDKVVEPDIDWESAKPKYYIAVMEAIFGEIFGGDVAGMAAEIEEELSERRAEAAGN